MKYLYLAVLPIFLALILEVFGSGLSQFGLNQSLLNEIMAALYVAGASFMLAYIAGLKKAKKEQQYVLYLIVLAAAALRIYVLLM